MDLFRVQDFRVLFRVFLSGNAQHRHVLGPMVIAAVSTPLTCRLLPARAVLDIAKPGQHGPRRACGDYHSCKHSSPG